MMQYKQRPEFTLFLSVTLSKYSTGLNNNQHNKFYRRLLLPHQKKKIPIMLQREKFM